MTLPISIADVEAAAGRIRGRVRRTPVVRSRTLDALAGAELHLKAENLQRTGSFKVRGAFNALLQLGPGERDRGVLAVSSGNHAQAVALAARECATTAVVVVPGGSNPLKVAAARGYGAEIVSDGVTHLTRERIVRELAAERGLPLVHPFDDPRVMAGQGTCGLELAERSPGLDAVVVPVGGGGLISGVATAVKARSPGTRVVGVEPAAADDAARSLRGGRRVLLEHAPQTVCDGVRALGLGEHTWPVVRELVDDIVTVGDDEVLEALDVLLTRTKLVVEPSAALPLAAVLAGGVAGERLGLVVSGGNLDPEVLRQPRGGSTPNQRR